MRLAGVLLLLTLGTATEVVVLARSSGRPSAAAAASSSASRRSSRGGSSGSRGESSGRSGRRGGASRRHRDPIEDDDDDDDDNDDMRFEHAEDDVDNAGDDYDEDYDEDYPAPRRGSASSSSSSSAGGGGRSGRRTTTRGPPSSSQTRGGRRPGAQLEDYDNEEEEEDEYDEEQYPPPRRRSSSSSSSARRGASRGGAPPPRREGRVVSYGNRYAPSRRGRGTPPPSTFTRGLSAIRDRMPDPNAVKDTVISATKAAQERTAQLSSNIYREVKGLTSSELEQVMLKATRPDETPVKTKHVERLVGVTYQISGKYDIYDAVLRKLWNKMAEKDIRTKLKSVYVLHRFSVDGGPDHQEALKQRLRALRKTKDPKRSSGGRGGTRYFDSKVLLGVDDDPDNQGYRAFLSRYAHYVLTRAQTFGGVFNEISLASMPTSASSPPSKKGGRSKSKGDGAMGRKPKNPPLCEEHLKFAQMVLKAGLACTLHEGEDSESTAMCVERVAADLMGLTAAVATALKRELKQSPSSSSTTADVESSSDELTKQWCEFYAEELLPETKKFCKKVTNKLDAYGLYLPSRISASLSPELLEKGLKLGSSSSRTSKDADNADDEEEKVEAGEEAAEEEAHAIEEKTETCEAEGGLDGGKNAEVGDASMAMSVNTAAGTKEENEDEYDDEYDEYDEYE